MPCSPGSAPSSTGTPPTSSSTSTPPRLDPATGALVISEVATFITPAALVTVRKDASFPMDDVVARWDESMDLAKYAVGSLLYGLIDYVVDGHFEAVADGGRRRRRRAVGAGIAQPPRPERPDVVGRPRPGRERRTAGPRSSRSPRRRAVVRVLPRRA